jgi:hypothetical protein
MKDIRDTQGIKGQAEAVRESRWPKYWGCDEKTNLVFVGL